MNQYMFYSESELLNIITKRSGDDAGIQDIHGNDKDIMCWIGDGEGWKKYSIEEFVELVFPDKKYLGLISEGGIFVFPNKESLDQYLATHKENV